MKSPRQLATRPLLLAGLAACKTTSSPSRQVVDDGAIKGVGQGKLAADVRLSDADQREVNSTDGVVTLAWAKVRIQRRAADGGPTSARAVDGVTKVNNELLVESH